MTQKPNSFVSQVRASLMLLVLFTVLLGGVYPLLVLGFGQAAFSSKAGGSLIEKDGKVLGSKLIGQSFDEPKYFWGRLSATTPLYNASASTGTNLSPASPKLLEAANERLEALQKADSKNKLKIPVDLVTASASGLDPHISLAAANYQVERVAKARGKKPKDIEALVTQHAEGGIMGEKRVNVLLLNLALDEVK
ncbi:MAG: potassium-transporting ATPase subunit KdpC [Alphaproteobacteria bacterium]|nr:potassium-transporting ATPase subunit KdpC [Alphaproteobacteria bacterium]